MNHTTRYRSIQKHVRLCARPQEPLKVDNKKRYLACSHGVSQTFICCASGASDGTLAIMVKARTTIA